MKITVLPSSPHHAGKQFKIADWFAEKEHITRRQAAVSHETEKAYCFEFGNEDLTKVVWVPKSVCTKLMINDTLVGWMG